MAGAPDPQPVLPPVDDLPPGFTVDLTGSGLIVTSRKAANSVDPEAKLNRLLRWGRLTGYRTVYVRPAEDGGPATRVVAETSLFREPGGARAYFENELRARPPGAVPFATRAGDGCPAGSHREADLGIRPFASSS